MKDGMGSGQKYMLSIVAIYKGNYFVFVMKVRQETPSSLFLRSV